MQCGKPLTISNHHFYWYLEVKYTASGRECDKWPRINAVASVFAEAGSPYSGHGGFSN